MMTSNRPLVTPVIAMVLFAVLAVAPGPAGAAEVVGFAVPNNNIVMLHSPDDNPAWVQPGQIYTCIGETATGYSILFRKKDQLITAVVPFHDEWGRPTATTWEYSTALEENTIKITMPVRLQSGALILKKDVKYPVLSVSPNAYSVLYQFNELITTVMVFKAGVSFEPAPVEPPLKTPVVEPAARNEPAEASEDKNVEPKPEPKKEEAPILELVKPPVTVELPKPATEVAEEPKPRVEPPPPETVEVKPAEEPAPPNDTAKTEKQQDVPELKPEEMKKAEPRKSGDTDLKQVMETPTNFRGKTLTSVVSIVRACSSNLGYYVGVAPLDAKDKEFAMVTTPDCAEKAAKIYQAVKTSGHVVIKYRLTKPNDLVNATLIDITAEEDKSSSDK